MKKCKTAHVCVSLSTTVVHNTAQSSSDYLPFYPPDKHQSSDAVYCKPATNLKCCIKYESSLFGH